MYILIFIVKKASQFALTLKTRYYPGSATTHDSWLGIDAKFVVLHNNTDRVPYTDAQRYVGIRLLLTIETTIEPGFPIHYIVLGGRNNVVTIDRRFPRLVLRDRNYLAAKNSFSYMVTGTYIGIILTELYAQIGNWISIYCITVKKGGSYCFS